MEVSRMKISRLSRENIGRNDLPARARFLSRLPPGEGEALAKRYGGVAVSALKKKGLRELLLRAEDLLWQEGVSPETFARIAGISNEGETDDSAWNDDASHSKPGRGNRDVRPGERRHER